MAIEHKNEVTVTGEVVYTPKVEMVGKDKEYEKTEVVLEIRPKTKRRKKYTNLVVIEFGGDDAYDAAETIDPGDILTITGYVASREWEDKETGKTRFFTAVRGRDWVKQGEAEPERREFR